MCGLHQTVSPCVEEPMYLKTVGGNEILKEYIVNTENIHFEVLFFVLFLFLFCTACRSSWARDRTHATAVTRATAVTMWILNPTEPRGNS